MFFNLKSYKKLAEIKLNKVYKLPTYPLGTCKGLSLNLFPIINDSFVINLYIIKLNYSTNQLFS